MLGKFLNTFEPVGKIREAGQHCFKAYVSYNANSIQIGLTWVLKHLLLIYSLFLPSSLLLFDEQADKFWSKLNNAELEIVLTKLEG